MVSLTIRICEKREPKLQVANKIIILRKLIMKLKRSIVKKIASGWVNTENKIVVG